VSGVPISAEERDMSDKQPQPIPGDFHYCPDCADIYGDVFVKRTVYHRDQPIVDRAPFLVGDRRPIA
jgi:hypothetical protein